MKADILLSLFVHFLILIIYNFIVYSQILNYKCDIRFNIYDYNLTLPSIYKTHFKHIHSISYQYILYKFYFPVTLQNSVLTVQNDL